MHSPQHSAARWFRASCLVLGMLLPAPAWTADPGAEGLPMAFVRSGTSAEAEFTSRFGPGGVCVRLGHDAFDILLADTGAGRGHVLRIAFEGATDLSVEGPVAGRFHAFTGRDPAAWQRNELGYRRATYATADTGSLVLSGSRSGLSIALRGRPSFRISGATDVRVEHDALLLDTNVGPLILTPQGPARWRVDGDRVTWLGAQDSLAELFTVSWSTHLGGSSSGEGIRDVVVGDDGWITTCGWTLSDDFPITPGAFEPDFTSPGWFTGFVTRVSPDGSDLAYSTYIGGKSTDEVRRLLALDDGDVLIAGRTSSKQFPTTPGAFDSTWDEGGIDVFVARLTADGSDLVFSSLFGSKFVFVDPFTFTNGTDFVNALALTPAGDIVIAGCTQSTAFPTTEQVFQTVASCDEPASEGFVAILDATASNLIASTYLGSGGDCEADWVDDIRAVTVRDDGSIVVAGETGSDVFPTTSGAFQETPQTDFGGDGFVACFTPDLSDLVFSTMLGGSLGDEIWDMAEGPDGSIVVVGITNSGDFPVTPQAFDPDNAAWAVDAFITHLDPTGSFLRSSTYFGGGASEWGPLAVEVDSTGAVTVAGGTWSHTLPTTAGAFQEAKAGTTTNRDLFVSRFHPNRRSLLYSTYLGGSDEEKPSDMIGLALTPEGDVVLGATTSSPDFPTTPGTLQPQMTGAHVDAILARLVMLPHGADRYGQAAGHVEPRIGVLSQPAVGNDGFGFTCAGAPAGTQGLLVISQASASPAVPLGDLELWVDPTALQWVLPAGSDALGWSQQRVPIPADPVLDGLQLFAQYAWPVRGDEPWASSAALRITVQP